MPFPIQAYLAVQAFLVVTLAGLWFAKRRRAQVRPSQECCALDVLPHLKAGDS